MQGVYFNCIYLGSFPVFAVFSCHFSCINRIDIFLALSQPEDYSLPLQALLAYYSAAVELHVLSFQESYLIPKSRYLSSSSRFSTQGK